MGFFEQFSTMKEDFFQLLLDPQRVDAWLNRLRECGVAAEIEWRPQNLEDLVRNTQGCIARIRLDGVAINAIEIVKNVSRQKRARDTISSSGDSIDPIWLHYPSIDSTLWKESLGAGIWPRREI